MKLFLVLSLMFLVVSLSHAQNIGVIDPERVVQTSEIGKKKLAEIKILNDKKQAEIKAMKNTGDTAKAVRDAKSEIQRELQAAIRNIEDKVLPIIKKMGEERGYLVIIQKDQLVYYNPKLDVTDEVIRLLNSSTAADLKK